ncbi:hypothetical protein MtrunA17_Chr7g0220591 [Medicago truncatula]|uniref:Uncharacterized protein n=1 Tax=Medicago truncatula TaxID=3880 RepID=A0A396GTR9_MEDTR|nr:hypothetical protein MtrunA17_Chr7g0220591 [Medicago truncatula]
MRYQVHILHQEENQRTKGLSAELMNNWEVKEKQRSNGSRIDKINIKIAELSYISA